MEHSGRRIGRKELLTDLEEKAADSRFLSDVPALIRVGLDYDPAVAFDVVSEKLIALVPE